MAQGQRFHHCNGPERDRLVDWQEYRPAPLQHRLNGRELGLVARALEDFKVADRRDRQGIESIESTRSLTIAAQVPDQHIRIDQHGAARSAFVAGAVSIEARCAQVPNIGCHVGHVVAIVPDAESRIVRDEPVARRGKGGRFFLNALRYVGVVRLAELFPSG